MQEEDHACLHSAFRKHATTHLALVYIRLRCTIHVHRATEHRKQCHNATLQQNVYIISMQLAQCTSSKVVDLRLYKSQIKCAELVCELFWWWSAWLSSESGQLKTCQVWNKRWGCKASGSQEERANLGLQWRNVLTCASHRMCSNCTTAQGTQRQLKTHHKSREARKEHARSVKCCRNDISSRPTQLVSFHIWWRSCWSS